MIAGFLFVKKLVYFYPLDLDSMATGVCLLCGNQQKLIKAHIVPKSFLNFGSQPIAIFSSDENSRPQKSPVGVYDEYILCEECDNELGLLDQYVVLNLIRADGIVVVDQEDLKCLQYQGVDTNILYKFIASVAWRASKSKHEFFSRVNLGPYEDIFLSSFKVGANSQLQTDIFVTEFDKKDVPFLSPESIRIENVNMLRIPANRFVFYIKVDKRKSPLDMEEFAVGDNKPVLSIVQSWNDSREKQLVLKIIKRNQRPNFWK
jgi:hypothetical protein